MYMKRECSPPNDKKSGPQNFGSNGGSGKPVVVPATDTKPGGYDGKNVY